MRRALLCEQSICLRKEMCSALLGLTLTPPTCLRTATLTPKAGRVSLRDRRPSCNTPLASPGIICGTASTLLIRTITRSRWSIRLQSHVRRWLGRAPRGNLRARRSRAARHNSRSQPGCVCRRTAARSSSRTPTTTLCAPWTSPATTTLYLPLLSQGFRLQVVQSEKVAHRKMS
eukprot:Rmarinus@m.22956